MLSSGFNINKCIYVKKKTNTIYVIVCLYVDNMLVLGSNADIIKITKKILTNKFDMKNINVIDVILGIRIYKTHDALILS